MCMHMSVQSNGTGSVTCFTAATSTVSGHVRGETNPKKQVPRWLGSLSIEGGSRTRAVMVSAGNSGTEGMSTLSYHLTKGARGPPRVPNVFLL